MAQYTTDFTRDKHQKEAESQAMDLVKHYYPEAVLTDTSEDKAYQKMDVDFKAEPYFIDEVWRDVLFEVKNCDKIDQTANLFVELKHYDYFASPGLTKLGWYYKTKADYILYRNNQNKAFIWFRLEDLREYIDNHELKKGDATDYKYYESENKRVQHKKVKGYLVPVYDFYNYCIARNRAFYCLDKNGEAIHIKDFVSTQKRYAPKERAI